MKTPVPFNLDASLADPVFGTVDETSRQELAEKWGRVFKGFALATKWTHPGRVYPRPKQVTPRRLPA